jgi:tetratricopeptide (TPR) repeat protein
MSPELSALARHVEGCRASGRLHEATRSLERIVQLDPRAHFAWALLGLAAVRRGAAETALAPIERALALDRDNADYLNLLGVAFGELQRWDEADRALRKALRRRPAYVDAYFNLGKLLEKRGDPVGARDAFARAAAIAPTDATARFAHGRALFLAAEYQAAVRVLEDAVAAAPADEWSVAMLGAALGAVRGPEAEIACYREALGRLPASGMLWRNLAHALLGAGRFREGWVAYARRDVPGRAPQVRLPERLPPDLRGKAVLLLPEQGLGDVLFFLRFAPVIVDRGGSVRVAAPRRLAPLLARHPLLDRVIHSDEPQPGAAALSLSVADLPFAVDADATPPALPLAADPGRVDGWRDRLAGFGPPPYLGVTWSAGTDFRRRAEFGGNTRAPFKGAPVDALAGTLRDASASVVCLQRDPPADDLARFRERLGRGVLDAADANEDLEDVLALLAALDGYVGVSNTNMHLLAGLGRGAHVLVPYPPEWRWMTEGARSPWFPAFGVHRQRTDRRWDDALAGLARALAATTAGAVGGESDRRR